MTHEENLKKEVKFYKFIRKNVGKEFRGYHLKSICGVSYKTELNKTRIKKYTMFVVKSGPWVSATNIYLIRDVIWIDEKFMYKNDLMNRSIIWKPLLGLNLIDKDIIPWWLLKDHGGAISDNELIKRVDECLNK
jgi:hypothetical protein